MTLTHAEAVRTALCLALTQLRRWPGDRYAVTPFRVERAWWAPTRGWGRREEESNENP